jgi:preprotein translocase subunit SecB
MSQTEKTSVNFVIQRIYVKDLSFEAPSTPNIFREQWKPEMNVDLQTHHKLIEDSVYDIHLHITVTVKQADKIAFLAEVKQAGIFSIEGLFGLELQHAINSYCPNILFPYARETLTDMVNRGGFPQLILAPINFDALYQDQLAKQGQAATAQNEPAGAEL